MALGEFMGTYFSEGFGCLVMFTNEEHPDDTCEWTMFYLIGYVVSLFTIQISLSYLMSAKHTKNARIIFSLMVPLTMAAFLLATFSADDILYTAPSWIEITALVLIAFGVWLYNWFEEKPQKASIETLM